MKRFILKLLFLSCCLIVIDFLYGAISDYFFFHSSGGENEKMVTACDRTCAEILIMGPSKAKVDYNPQIIEDSLSMSCYNCGHGGTGILLMYGIFKMVTQRYTPRLIIYDTTADNDFLERDESKDLPMLRPFYDRPGIDSIFWDVDLGYKYRMHSNLYKYNSNLLSLLTSWKENKPFINGFEPFYDPMGAPPVINRHQMNEINYSQIGLYYFERLMQECQEKGIKLMITVGPTFMDIRGKEYNKLISMCEKYEVPFYDNIDDDFNSKIEYFHDTHHLTFDGATIYTNKVIQEVKQSYNF